MAERLEGFTLFDPGRYGSLHEDVRASGVDPLRHFLEHGLEQGREFATSTDIAASLASFPEPVAPDRLAPDAEAAVLRWAADKPIGIYVSSVGNFFMREIAELTAAGLRSLGAKAELLDENTSISNRPEISIFVAPHEFFRLGRGREWATDDVISSAFMFSTEQMQTPWFREGLPYLLACRGLIDLNYQTLKLMEGSGLPTLFYFPGYDYRHGRAAETVPDHPLAAALPRAARCYDVKDHDWPIRPIDVVFIGSESPLRESFLATSAPFFASLSCFIHYVRLRSKPILASGPDTRPSLNRYVYRRSKIAINIHQGGVPYFEWHRMVMQAMWQGTLVLSEPCLPHPVFKPGIHYLEEHASRIPDLIRWILETPRGHTMAEEVRRNAAAALVGEASRRRWSLVLAEFLTEHCS